MKMKSWFVNVMVCCGFPLALSANLARAEDTPPDVADLVSRWEQAEKTPDAGQWLDMTYGESAGLDGIFDQERQLLVNLVGHVTSFSHRIINKNIRNEIVRELFSKQNGAMEYCSALFLNPTVRENANSTPEERAAAERRAYLSACRKQVSTIFGGMLYAAPEAQIFLAGGDEKEPMYMIAYVSSLVSPSHYVRYQLRLR